MRNATVLSVLISACLALSCAQARADDTATTANSPGATELAANVIAARSTYANVTDANVTNADVTDANVTDADVTDANVTDAKVTDANVIDAGAVDAIAASLKAGEFQWLGEDPGRGGLLTVVDLSQQRAIVYRSGQPIAVTTVSTGMPGRETPTGVFPILAKETMHHSNLYNDAPMPFMQRLTWDGIALHAGHVRDRPASHGCVRLPKAFAEQLYSVTSKGETVVIAQDNSAAALIAAGLPEWQAMQVGREVESASSALASNDHGGAAGGNVIGAIDAPH